MKKMIFLHAGIYFAYSIVFILLYKIIGARVAALQVIPAAIIAWQYGLRGGVISSIIVLVLNGVLLNFLDSPGVKLLLINWPAVSSLFLSAFIIGYLRDLSKQLNLKNSELKEEHCYLKDLIQTQKQTEVELRNLIKERETLLAEIHHRVKNNLQIMSSLLYFQSKKLKNERDKQIFLENEQRIKTIALVHENFYQSDSFSEININTYFKKLVAQLSNKYVIKDKQITFTFDISDISLTIDKAIPCGLIINELVLNAIKHAFSQQDNPEIIIKFYPQVKSGTNYYTLIVKDNGSGMPTLNNLDRSENFGLYLVNILTEQIDGFLEQKNNNGASFKISFLNQTL